MTWDWEEIKKNIAACYVPFACECGGTFFVIEQRLIQVEGRMADLMTYTCNKCKKTETKTFDAPHLNQ